MEELIRELNNPVNQSSSERIHELQRQIQQHQRERSGWDKGFDLLRSNDQTFRFYGALTLTIKINADWENDGLSEDGNARKVLLEGLINLYSQLVNASYAPFVLLKLCSTITAYFIKDNSWHLAVRQLATSLLHSQYVHSGSLPDTCKMKDLLYSLNSRQLCGTLWFASTLVEEVSRLDNGTSRSALLAERLASNSEDVWLAIQACLDRLVGAASDKSGLLQASMPQLLDIEAEEVAKIALPMIVPWLERLPSEHEGEKASGISVLDLASICIAQIFACFSHSPLQDMVIQSLTGLTESCYQIFQQVGLSTVASITTSPQAAKWVDEMQHGDFSTEGVHYVEFLISLINSADLSSPAYLEDKMTLANILTLKELMRCQGIAVVEDEICQLVLECLNEVVEQYNEWAEDERGNSDMKGFVTDVCLAAVTKAEFPTSEIDADTSEWDTDDRAKFQDFRNDVADFIASSYVALGFPIIEALVSRVVSSDLATNWSTFEASLFCLLEFSDTTFHDSQKLDSVIHAILSSSHWAAVTQHAESSPSRVRQTAMRFVAQHTGYLRRNVDFLIPCLDFLFRSLQVFGSTQAASRAIQTLCYSERVLLIEALPQFMSSLPSLERLEPTVRHKIYSAIAAIIQALPKNIDKVQPLRGLLDSVSSITMQAPLDGRSSEQAGIMLDLLQALAAIGKGLRAPADTVIDLDSSELVSEETAFWNAGAGHQVQQEALSLCTYALNNSGTQQHGEIVEAACDFVKSGYTEDDPSPFKFSAAISVDFLTSQIYIDNPSIDAVMACASTFLASADKTMDSSLFARLVDPVFSSCRALTTQYQSTRSLPPGDFPSSSVAFLTRLLPRWSSSLFGLSVQDNLVAVFDLALVLLATSDTLPRRTASSFFAAIFDLTSHNKSLTETASYQLATILSTYTAPIIASVLNLIAGECARSEIEAVTEVLRKLVSNQTSATRRLLKDAMDEQAGVLSLRAYRATTLQQRQRFIAQAEALRGARKTIELAKDFWLATRGDAFGYVT